MLLEIQPLRALEVTPDIEESVDKLLFQLDGQSRVLVQEEIAEIARQQGVRLFLAYQDGHVVGMLTAIVYQCPTRTSMVIEDVVVDEQFRRQGIGKRLVEVAIAWARELKVETVDLTSSPNRQAARRLYESLGFVIRDTSVYRLVLGS